MNSGMFKLNLNDLLKGLVVAVLGGILLPVLAMLQTPGFDITHVNLQSVWVLALNGGIAAAAAYLVKNFFSSADGKVLGRLG